MKPARLIITFLTILVIATGADAVTPKKKRNAPAKTAVTSTPRSAENIKKERNATEKKISETSTKIDKTGRELKRQLNALNSINADIRQQEMTVSRLRSRIDSIGSAINVTTDSIAILERQLEDMRRAYADALRKLQPSAGDMNMLSFIFSSGSFSEAYSRLRYLSRFSEWRRAKADDIDRALDRVAARRQHLTGLRHEQDKAFRMAEDARRSLAAKQNEGQKLVKDLKKQDSQLRTQLAEQKRQAQALDRELDRIIAAEQERIAREEAARKGNKNNSGGSKSTPSGESIARESTAPLTGSFESNKGSLLFPVSGRYKIVRQFGRHPHPTQKHVITDNSGIDIEVAQGSQARAVFDGTVSAIFRQDGFQTIVMLRHGKYLTIYAGLSSASVKQGQQVKAGQPLGTIYADPSDSGRTILHFEVRDERTKLNPTLWVR